MTIATPGEIAFLIELMKVIGYTISVWCVYSVGESIGRARGFGEGYRFRVQQETERANALRYTREGWIASGDVGDRTPPDAETFRPTRR